LKPRNLLLNAHVHHTAHAHTRARARADFSCCVRAIIFSRITRRALLKANRTSCARQLRAFIILLLLYAHIHIGGKRLKRVWRDGRRHNMQLKNSICADINLEGNVRARGKRQTRAAGYLFLFFFFYPSRQVRLLPFSRTERRISCNNNNNNIV